MNRRAFSLQLAGLAGMAGLAGLGALPRTARAQGAPTEGTQYTRLAQPVPVSASGKVEVVEFFWYGCPHCNAFEPSLEPWVKKLPEYVQFRRVPVAFDALKERHQKLYYAIETLGLVEQLHAKTFARFHAEHRPLNSDADMVAFAVANGIDKKRFADALASFGVATKMRQAKSLSEAYRIDGVPTLGVQGRFITSPASAGGQEQALRVADYLIAQVHKGA